jgi:hypothetical protein
MISKLAESFVVEFGNDGEAKNALKWSLSTRSEVVVYLPPSRYGRKADAT